MQEQILAVNVSEEKKIRMNQKFFPSCILGIHFTVTFKISHKTLVLIFFIVRKKDFGFHHSISTKKDNKNPNTMSDADSDPIRAKYRIIES